MTTRPAPVAAPPLGRNRDFRLLWFGEGTHLLGTMTTAVVLPLLAARDFHASPMWMGMLSAASWLPWLLLGLHAGALVDRSDTRRVMIAADLLAAVVLASVPVAWALDRLTLPHVVLAALGAGAAQLVLRLAMAPMLTRVVGPADLEAANSRIYGTESAAQVVGPGLGGLMVQWLTAAVAILADAVSCVVSAVCLWRIRARPTSRPTPKAEPVGRAIRDGARFVLHDPILRYTLVSGGLSNLGLIGYQALLVLYMVRELHLDAGMIGLFTSIGSAGGLLGALIAPAVGRRLGTARGAVVLGLLGGPTALLIPLAAPGWRAWLIPAGAFLVGVGVVGANVIRSAFRQRWVPPDSLGRVGGVMSVVAMGTMPVGSLVAGWAGAAYGLVPTMLAMAGLHALCSLTLATPLCPFWRLRDLPAGRSPAAG
ncbi:MAG: MFS transporter [Micrococcales bacterium]|nr:MFS transporter [Micrococcales bacterium]